MDAFKDSSKGHSKNLSLKSPTNHLPKPPTDHSTKSLMDSSTEHSTDPPSLPSPSKDPVLNSPKNLTKYFTTNPRLYLSEDEWLNALAEQLGQTSGLEDLTYSMKPGHMPKTTLQLERFDLGNIEKFMHNNPLYPFPRNIKMRAEEFFSAVLNFCLRFVKRENFVLDANEVDRVQQLYDEFGQTDPGFPPALMVKLLEEGDCQAVAERVIYWAILSNLTEDGDIQHTLLPARLVALYQELDHQSTKEHQITAKKWRHLTFGLLKGGYARFATSEEWRPAVNRITRFLIKTLGPYCLETDKSGLSISTEIETLFKDAIPLGYLIFGYQSRTRWDWNMVDPHMSENFGRVPGIALIITTPALLLVDNMDGTIADTPRVLVHSQSAVINDPNIQNEVEQKGEKPESDGKA